jgi:chitinase
MTTDRGRMARMFTFATLAILVPGCGSSAAPDPSQQPSQPADSAFRVIGYVIDRGARASDEQLRQLTHVNYAFALPQADGALLDVANPRKLEGYVETAHEHGVRVLISVGGWGWDAEFEQLAASPDSRSRFVAEVVALVDEYALDGADIDWEYPDPGASSESFTALMSELRAALPDGALLTAAVAALGSSADGVSADVFPIVDFLNLMAYDGSDSGGHASMRYAEDALAYWEARGLPAEQCVLGVPFYSRPLEIPYRDLVEDDASAPEADEIEYLTSVVNYNGMETMRRKTALAMERASGIMFWKLDDDTTDETSLLRVIRAAVDGGS